MPHAHQWVGPSPAMHEDGDLRQRCAMCPARREPPAKRWTQVALLHLPLSPSVLHEVTEWLSIGVHERGGHELVIVQDAGSDYVEAGFWQTVQA